MKKDAQLKETTLKGYIVPIKWDGDGNVISIELSTDDEDYLVEMDGVGWELLDHADEEVEVTGIISDERDTIKSITVINYELLGQDGSGDDEVENLIFNDEGTDFENSQGENPF
jgi:hypothetical protein